MDKQRLLSILAACASFFALCVIALGAYTRLIDAGLGCPDWPGCYGLMTVPMSDQAKAFAATTFSSTPLVAYKAWAEMIHRYFVGGLSFFILAILFFITTQKVVHTRSNVLFALGLFLLLVYQILLGRWTVTLKLLPIVVTQHLLGGFCILSLLWLLYLNNKKIIVDHAAQAKKILPVAIIAVLILLLQISLGAWTSTNYAALSCGDFPFCSNENPWMVWLFKEAFTFSSHMGLNYEGGVLPEAVRQTIQMTHRLGALVFTVYFVGLLLFAVPRVKKSISLMKSIFIMMGLLIVQLCIGISNVIFKLPLVTAIAHNLVAVLLLLALLTFTFKLTRKVSV